MEEKVELEQLLKNISKGLKKYTIKQLNDGIVSFLEEKDSKASEVKSVLDLVANEYKISVNTLKKSNPRGERTDARHTAYCLMHFSLGLPIRYIASRIFNTWPNSVQIGIKRYQKMNESIKPEKEFLDKYRNIQKELLTLVQNKK